MSPYFRAIRSSVGEGAPPCRLIVPHVPHSTFWFVNATELLRATLIEARALGLRRVRVTCDKDNMPEHGRIVSRYWIDL